jgi:hypothetical protein
MKINTELCCKRYDFLTKKTQTIVIRIIVWMTIFKSIHMAFYVNTSWACALFRNNKHHVVLGQKRNCQRVEESGHMLGLPINNNQAKSLPLQREIWRVALPWVRSIQRQWSNWSPTYILHLFHLEDTSLLILLCCLLFSIVFHILWIYDDAYDHFREILINICNFAPDNSKLLSMSSIKRPYLRGKQTQILRGQQRGNGSAKMISIPYIYPAFVPFGRYFTSNPLYLWIRQSTLSSTRWQFLFCPGTTCCLLFLVSAWKKAYFDGFRDKED